MTEYSLHGIFRQVHVLAKTLGILKIVGRKVFAQFFPLVAQRYMPV